MKTKPLIYVIVGPTASGKSSLGIALAEKINGEIISADSMQIYRGLDIGTAKADQNEQAQCVHYLIDIKDVENTYSVSDFVKDANCAIEKILNNNKVPIVVGGTGLYINALVNNMSFNDELDDDKINESILSIEKQFGANGLYSYLEELDESSAKLIDKNNTNRLKRAIKMSLIGNKKSESDSKQDLWRKNGNSKYNFYIIKLCLPREELYNKINQRVDIMVEKRLNKRSRIYKKQKFKRRQYIFKSNRI